MVSVDDKHHVYVLFVTGGLRSCVRVEVAVLGSPSLIIKPHGSCGRKATLNQICDGVCVCVCARACACVFACVSTLRMWLGIK